MLPSVIFRLALRYISRRLFQSILFIIGVALGVAVVIAIDIANDSARRAFSLSTDSITGKATHQIIGGPGGIPTSLYTDLRVNNQFRASAPIISEFVTAVDLGDQPLRLLGVDPFAEPPFRSYLTEIRVEGENQNEAQFAALNNFITEPGTALISTSLADRYGIQPGESISISASGEQVAVRIVGILQPEDSISQQALDDLLLTDIATAQEITRQPGRITRVDLILPEGFDTAMLPDDLLPAGTSLRTIRGEGNTLSQMTAAFEVNLQALSMLALIVGLFLIYNTVTFSVVQRRPVLGIMRSLGATRPQIFSFILGEAFLLSLAGTVLGLGLGIIFGRMAVGLVSQTITDLYFTVNVQRITVDSFALLKGGAIGLFTGVGVAIVPAFDATRTPPISIMRRSQFEQRTRTRIPQLVMIAVIMGVIGYLLLQIPTDSLVASFLALFCIILSGALLVPVVLLIGMRLATPITYRIFGVLGRMAPRAVVRSLSRTSVAVAALTIAVSVIVGVSAMISSFRSTVADWLNNTLVADIFISPAFVMPNQATIDLDPEVMDLVKSVGNVQEVSAVRAVSVLAPDYPDLLPVNLLASSFDIARETRRFAWANIPQDEHMAALEAGQVMVSEPFAFHRGITPENNTITLETEVGEQTFTIFGVYYDYSTDQGSVYMSRKTYDRYFDDPFITSVAAFVEDENDIPAVMEALRSDVLQEYRLQIHDNRGLRQEALAVFDRTFAITVALRMLATVVAFIGILSALVALQLEHTREYGMMRASGLTSRQLWGYTLIQTGLMGTVAGIMALPIGLVLATVLVYVINLRSFGWTMQFTLAPNEFAEAFLVALVAALLAGLYPAWRLMKLSVAEALRSE